MLYPITFNTIESLVNALSAAEKSHKDAGLPAEDWQRYYAEFLFAQGQPNYQACIGESNPVACTQKLAEFRSVTNPFADIPSYRPPYLGYE